jgi:hypothetical protein
MFLQPFKHLLHVFHTISYNQVEDNNIVYVTLGKIKNYQHLIHGLLEICKGITTLVINNPSNEDISPKMSFWPCHSPLMAIHGSQTTSWSVEIFGLPKGVKNLI